MLAELVARGIIPDRIYGASVGAVNGAAFAGDPTEAGIEHLHEVWRRIKGEDIFPGHGHTGPGDGFSCGRLCTRTTGCDGGRRGDRV